MAEKDLSKSIDGFISKTDKMLSQWTKFGTTLDKIGGTLSKLSGKMGNVGGNIGGTGQKQLGVSGGTQNLMSSSMANFSTPSVAGQSMGGIPAGFGGIGGLAKAAATGMPDIQATIGYAGGYYNAGIMGGAKRRVMQQATFGAISSAGGMTSAGADQRVASMLAGRGMNFSGAAGSTYMQTVSMGAGISRYLNMPVEASTQAVADLTGGQSSSNLMKRFGIFTSDLATGKEKPMSQVFEELATRLTVRQSTPDRTRDSIRRGALGEAIRNSGLSSEQQSLFAQYMIDRAGGKADKWKNNLQGMGEDNPLGSSYDINASETEQYGKASEQYIQGMKDAVPLVQALNDQFGDLASKVGNLNAMIQTVTGSRGGQGVLQGVGAAGNVLGGVASGALTGAALGTMVAPGVGTAIGAVAGGILGAVAGSGGDGTNNALGPSTAGGAGGAGGTNNGQGNAVFRLIRPVSARVTLGYGVKDSNHTGGHNGIDYGAAEGTPVQAAADGKVIAAQRGSGTRSFGNYVKIDHGNGFVTLYAHLSRWTVSTGTQVKSGQVIGYSGSTGFSTGPHLHFQLEKNGSPTNPGPYMGGGVAITGALPDGSSASADQSSADSSHYVGAAGIVTANMSGVSGNTTSVNERIGAVPSASSSAASAAPLGSGSNSGSAVYSAAGGGTGGGDLGGTATAQTNTSAEQIAEWKSHSLSNKNSSGANVTINVNVAQATDAEARRLATMVKKYLNEDKHVDKMENSNMTLTPDILPGYIGVAPTSTQAKLNTARANLAIQNERLRQLQTTKRNNRTIEVYKAGQIILIETERLYVVLDGSGKNITNKFTNAQNRRVPTPFSIIPNPKWAYVLTLASVNANISQTETRIRNLKNDILRYDGDPSTTPSNNTYNSTVFNSDTNTVNGTTTPPPATTPPKKGNLVYNVGSVKEAYFAPEKKVLNTKTDDPDDTIQRHILMSAYGNTPKRDIKKAMDLWKTSTNHKGMIATWTPTTSQGVTNPPGATNVASDQITQDTNKYAFQFQYNPGQITMAYKGSPAIDVSMYTSGTEDYAPWTGSQYGGTINFELVINRMFDMKYYDKTGKLIKKGVYVNRDPYGTADKAKVKQLFNEQKTIYDRGTMYDVEFFLRTVMGFTMPTQFRGTTADVGWVGAMPVELHLGVGMRYWVTIEGFTVNHVIFNERMVPTFSTVNITANRIPDYAVLPTSA